MYREYRDMPVINRTCMKATQDRAYQKHVEALQKTKATINTQAPNVPRTIGLNMKKYENEKQRNEEIAKQNMRLFNDIKKIQNRKKSPSPSPQTHFTLRGQYHVEQAEQIDRENRKLVEALVSQKPNIKRTDFYYHNCDHLYQVNKMSIHKKTVPMSQIMRQKLPPMEDISVPKSTRTRAPRKIPQLDSSKAPSTSRDSLFVTNKGNSDQLLQIAGKDSINQEEYHHDDIKSKADEMHDDHFGLILGKVYDDMEEEEECNDEFYELMDSSSKGDENVKNDSKGKLDQITDDNLGVLIGNKKEDKSEDESLNDDDSLNTDSDNSNQVDDIINENKDGNDNSNKDDSKGKLDNLVKNKFDNLFDPKNEADNNNNSNDENDICTDKDSKGKLDNMVKSNLDALMDSPNEVSSQKSSDDDRDPDEVFEDSDNQDDGINSSENDGNDNDED